MTHWESEKRGHNKHTSNTHTHTGHAELTNMGLFEAPFNQRLQLAQCLICLEIRILNDFHVCLSICFAYSASSGSGSVSQRVVCDVTSIIFKAYAR